MWRESHNPSLISPRTHRVSQLNGLFARKRCLTGTYIHKPEKKLPLFHNTFLLNLQTLFCS
jgi:ribonuclease D